MYPEAHSRLQEVLLGRVTVQFPGTTAMAVTFGRVHDSVGVVESIMIGFGDACGHLYTVGNEQLCLFYS